MRNGQMEKGLTKGSVAAALRDPVAFSQGKDKVRSTYKNPLVRDCAGSAIKSE